MLILTDTKLLFTDAPPEGREWGKLRPAYGEPLPIGSTLGTTVKNSENIR